MSRPHGAASFSTPSGIVSARSSTSIGDGVGRGPFSLITWAKSVPAADLLVTIAFAVIVLLQLANHEMWRDEIHSWGVVLASPSLSDLFANLKFTGHPGLWYLILWLASFVTDSPYALQAVHGVIAVLLVGMIGLVSPFSRLEKVLLLSSYFVLFEYTVVSRNYGLGFLIALAYAQTRATRPGRLLVNAGLLGLLANTNLFAFVLSGAFALEYALDLLLQRKKELGAALRRLLPAAVIYAAFAALAIATMWPSPDISWRTTGVPLRNAWDPFWLLATIAGNLESLIPTHPLSYWNPAAEETLFPQGAFLLPAFGLVFFYMFRTRLRLLIIPALTLAGSVAIGQLIYSNAIRHWGINFVAFVAAFWIRRLWDPTRSYLAIGLLAVNAVAGIVISAHQFPLTFSEGKATAQWIEANGLADSALVGTPDTVVSVVAQYLGKPIYFLDCRCTDNYLVFHRRRDDFNRTQIPERLARAAEELEGRPILFLITRPLDETERAHLAARGIEAEQIAAFDQASWDENYYVYRIAAAGLRGSGS